MRVPVTTTVEGVALAGELTDERPEYPGQAVLVVDSPIEHSGIWPSFDDRKPTDWRAVGPISDDQAKFLIRHAPRGWRIGWSWHDLQEGG